MKFKISMKHNVDKLKDVMSILGEFFSSNPVIISDEAKKILSDVEKRKEFIKLLQELKNGERDELKYEIDGEELEFFIDNSFKVFNKKKTTESSITSSVA